MYNFIKRLAIGSKACIALMLIVFGAAGYAVQTETAEQCRLAYKDNPSELTKVFKTKPVQ